MTPVKFSKYLFSCSLFFVLTSLVCAQEIKYVSYFPIPYANHTTLNVKTLALLGTKPGGSIIVGSGTNQSALTVGTTGASTFYTQDLSLLSANAPTGTPEMYIGSASGSVYDGTVNSSGDIGVVNYPTTITNLQAQGTALLRSVYWSGKGGIGKNSSGTADWPAQCDLVWKSLKIEGTDSYMNYLVCSSSGVVDPGGGPIGGTTIYVPATKTLAAAKYCMTEFNIFYNNWGKEYSYNTLNAKKVSYYTYANNITVTNDSQYDNSCTCPAGALDNNNVAISMGDSVPVAGAALGWKLYGHMKEHDFNFVTTLSLGDCESNLSDQQICDKHCSGSSCNYKCVKAKNIADQCGTPLDKKQCFCPKYGCCGLCEDGTGQRACGALGCEGNCCTPSTCGHTSSCAGSSHGVCGEYTDIRTYEPAIGTATVLYCTATTS